MALIFSLIIIIVLAFRGLSISGSKAKWEEENESFKKNVETSNIGFDRYIASKEETDDIRSRAFDDAMLYKKGCPADDRTSIEREMREKVWDEVHIQPNEEMITCAVLAQNGLVPWEMSIGPYRTCPIEPRREFWVAENKFLKWLDEELQSHGMPFQIRYIKKADALYLGFDNARVSSESIQQKNTLSDGIYYWTIKQARDLCHRSMISKRYDYNKPYVDYK